jgi:hypothetical protein
MNAFQAMILILNEHHDPVSYLADIATEKHYYVEYDPHDNGDHTIYTKYCVFRFRNNELMSVKGS